MFTWEYNGTQYDNVDPFKIIPVENDPNFGKPFWKAIGMTEEEANQVNSDYKWHLVRVERDLRISKTDWVSGEDVPQSIKDAYFPYRQALRDITEQEDPDNIVWPDKPL